MNDLLIHSVENKADLAKECIWLDVLEDIDDLSHYLVCDTTYSGGGSVSNELRHLYWFNKRTVKKGDWIKLMTKTGINSVTTNARKTTTHIFYWNLGKTIWNKDGDYAFVAKLQNWTVKPV